MTGTIAADAGVATSLVAGIALLGFALAGCGSGGEEGAAVAGAPAAPDSDRALAYSECMRENGVPEFPDPVEDEIQLRVGPGTGLDPQSPAFQAAQEACQSLAPSGPGAGPGDPEMEAQALEFAQCMRENGVPEFPDPEVSGGGVRMQLPPAVDQSAPEFEAAHQECSELLQGPAGTAP